MLPGASAQKVRFSEQLLGFLPLALSLPSRKKLRVPSVVDDKGVSGVQINATIWADAGSKYIPSQLISIS